MRCSFRIVRRARWYRTRTATLWRDDAHVPSTRQLSRGGDVGRSVAVADQRIVEDAHRQRFVVGAEDAGDIQLRAALGDRQDIAVVLDRGCRRPVRPRRARRASPRRPSPGCRPRARRRPKRARRAPVRWRIRSPARAAARSPRTGRDDEADVVLRRRLREEQDIGLVRPPGHRRRGR